MRLADLNGSGSRDIVWGNAGDYQFLDLMGGERPRLLEVVYNGLGGSTTIFYRTSVDYMVDDELTVRRRLPGAAEEEVHVESGSLTQRSTTANTAHVRSSKVIDRFGRATEERSEGIVGESGDEVVRPRTRSPSSMASGERFKPWSSTITRTSRRP